jgi:uncharacterized protein
MEGVRRLLGRLALWRVGIPWYLFSLLGVPLIMLLGTMIYSGDLPNLGALGGPSSLLSYLATYVFVVVLGGPLFEEIGWRGFALARMEALHGPLLASVILGVLWALWHLPEFLVPSWAASSGGGGILGIALFIVTAITFTIVITWVFNNTRASVLLAILVHTSIDAFTVPLGEIFLARTVGRRAPARTRFAARVRSRRPSGTSSKPRRATAAGTGPAVSGGSRARAQELDRARPGRTPYSGAEAASPPRFAAGD